MTNAPLTAITEGAMEPGACNMIAQLPPERRATCSIVEIRPVSHFVTYGLGVSLRHMRDTVLARARIPVGP